MQYLLIRMPYLCEGMIQGFLAGALAMGLIMVGRVVLADRLGGVIFFARRGNAPDETKATARVSRVANDRPAPSVLRSP